MNSRLQRVATNVIAVAVPGDGCVWIEKQD